MDQPDNFFSVIFHENKSTGQDIALCAGYESGSWRNDQLADHAMEWLPEFALNYSELMSISHSNAIRMAKKAARLVYQTGKYGNRGEFGELFLHIAIRQVFDTIPAVSKIYYKSAVNETVKGFDAVHVVRGAAGLELWIGETKFYTAVSRAITDVCKEIIDHLRVDYLKNEFLLIQNKIDSNWPEEKALRSLLNPNVTLDSVFKKVCIPVLLTYESKAVSGNFQTDQKYLDEVEIEIRKAYDKLRTDLGASYKTAYGVEIPVTIHVILIPLANKKSLIATLDKRLKALQ
ncbi:HamA C-terminal domain-containing protein [Janthinobacterium tructae]